MRILALLTLSFFAFSSCTKQKEFEIYELTIITKDAKNLALWYEKNLGFEPSNDFDLLYHESLTILLDENKDARHLDTVKRHLNIKELPGIFKFGFVTNQFDDLVKSLERNGVSFHGSVMYDSLLDQRMVIIKDPEGNRIQLFETNKPHKLKPHFIALIVEGIGEQEKWYQVKLPIQETYRKDLEDREIFIRLLKGDDVVVELIQLEKRPVRNELQYSEIMGFHQINIKGAKLPFESDHEGNKIIHSNN
ncbi:MAG: VOC family protein [Marinoscillum sp.]